MVRPGRLDQGNRLGKRAPLPGQHACGKSAVGFRIQRERAVAFIQFLLRPLMTVVALISLFNCVAACSRNFLATSTPMRLPEGGKSFRRAS
jgi:hypothetical protein